MKSSPPRGSAGGLRRTAAIIALSSLAISFVIFFLSGFSFGFVDGRSMLPGLSPGQFVVATSWAYGIRLGGAWRLRWALPRSGEVICLLSPEDGRRVVKRVAAVPGDLCEAGSARDSGDGHFTNDGSFIYVGRYRLPASPAEAFHFPPGTRVGEGEVFVAGDNPDESVDSRQYGFAAVEQVLGKVLACGKPPAGWSPSLSGKSSGD